MKVIYCLGLSISILFSAGYVTAQERSLIQEQQHITKYFRDSLSWEHVKDTTQLFVFTFNAVVEMDTTGFVHLVSLTASDTIAYQLYPGYEFLKGVNYKLFMGGRKKATFIFPVLLQTYSARRKEVETHTTSEVFNAIGKLFRGGNEGLNIVNCIYFGPFISSVQKSTAH